ncbi:MAG: zinc ribbon domain-containing protein [Acidiferrobacterales bacterium]
MDDSVDADDGHALNVQEEKLYEEYLTARAEQAASTAREAARIAATQPGNHVKIREAEQAKLAAAKAKAELAAQRAKLDEVPHNLPKTSAEARAAASPVGQRPVGAATSDPSRIANSSQPAATVAPTPVRPKAVSPSDAGRTKVAAPKLPPPTANPSHTSPPSGASGTERAGPNEGGTALRQAPTPSNAPATERVNGASYAKTAAMPSQETAVRPKGTSPMPAPAKTGDASHKLGPRTTAENDMPAPAPSDPTAVAQSNAAVPTRHPVAAAKAAAAAQAQKLAQALRSAQVTKTAAKVKSPQPQRAGVDSAHEEAPSPDKPNPAALATSPKTPQTARAKETTGVTHSTSKSHEAGTSTPRDYQPCVDPLRASPSEACPADIARSQGPPQALAVNPQKTNPQPAGTAAQAPEPPETTVPAPAAHARHELQAALETLTARAPTAAHDESPKDNTTPNGASTPETHVPETAPVSMRDSAGPTGATSAEIPQQADMKDCPNCTTLLPIDAERCHCGFAFVRVEERMPSLSLSDSDFAALDGTLPSGKITPLG